MDKEELLMDYIGKHENETCDCDEETMSLCVGGLYLGGSRTKEDIFNDWD